MPPNLWSNEWMRKNQILLIMLDNLVWRVLSSWSWGWWLWRRLTGRPPRCLARWPWVSTLQGFGKVLAWRVLACECDRDGKIIVCWGRGGHVDAGLGRGRRETTKMANEGFLLCFSYVSQVFKHLPCFLTVLFTFYHIFSCLLCFPRFLQLFSYFLT